MGIWGLNYNVSFCSQPESHKSFINRLNISGKNAGDSAKPGRNLAPHRATGHRASLDSHSFLFPSCHINSNMAGMFKNVFGSQEAKSDDGMLIDIFQLPS